MKKETFEIRDWRPLQLTVNVQGVVPSVGDSKSAFLSVLHFLVYICFAISYCNKTGLASKQVDADHGNWKEDTATL